MAFRIPSLDGARGGMWVSLKDDLSQPLSSLFSEERQQYFWVMRMTRKRVPMEPTPPQNPSTPPAQHMSITLVRMCNGTNAWPCYLEVLRLPCKNPPLGSDEWTCAAVPALSSSRMWTVWWLPNCLRYAIYHADTGPPEPLMCRSQVRVPWGDWVNSAVLLTVTLKGQ